MTARTVWRCEHGTRPLARYRRLLCALYDASSEELGFRVSQGEIDHACTIAADALASSGQLSSHRVCQLLHSLYAKLLPHAAARGVDDAVEALSAALGARVPAQLLIDAGQDPEP